MLSRALALVAALVLLAVMPATAVPDALLPPASSTGEAQVLATRDDATWTEHYIPAGDGVTHLHADVLRPIGIDDDVATPVILTVSPYTNHSGATADFRPTASGPSDRFFDFLDGTDALNRGYTYVMVDLPGFGGSGGCNDWGGPREQGAVATAVEWAASQEWSNGRVSLLGKSYDAWTGLMGIAQDPEGLEAVIAMEPVYSGYRYGYTDGVRFLNSAATPALFTVIDAKPGSLADDPMYHLNSLPLKGTCYAENLALQQQDTEDADYWAVRNLLETTVGKTTPLFLLQGFLETNTKPDGAFDVWNGLQLAPGSLAWFGQFDHDRGNDLCAGGAFCTGRADFFEQSLAFLDTHLKEVPAEESGLADLPMVSVQDNLGRYRSEASWPSADTVGLTTELRTGTYADDNQNRGSGNGTGQGLWSISQTLPYDVWLSGEPELSLTASTQAPRANLVANVYDLAPDGRATLISRGASLLRELGSQDVTLPMYGQDWLLKADHRIAVLVSGANAEWWVHVPTRSTVTVEEARITLPFLTFDRTEFLEGGTASPRLTSWLANRRTQALPAATISEGERHFTLPGALQTPEETEATEDDSAPGDEAALHRCDPTSAPATLCGRDRRP